MSNLFTELTNEAARQQKSVEDQKAQSETTQTDTATSPTDIANRRRLQTLDESKLKTIIGELSEIGVSTHGTPVRLSEAEKRDIEDFIYITLRQKGIEGKGVSGAKLMRYALRYLMKVHEQEFINALAEALKKDNKLSI
jgi:hypothetical protein